MSGRLGKRAASRRLRRSLTISPPHRYVVVKLVKYHTDGGTVEVDEDDQIEFAFKIK